MSRKNRSGRNRSHVDKYADNYNDDERYDYDSDYVQSKPSPKPKKKRYRYSWHVSSVEVHEVALDILGTKFYQYGKATEGRA